MGKLFFSTVVVLAAVHMGWLFLMVILALLRLLLPWIFLAILGYLTWRVMA